MSADDLLMGPYTTGTTESTAKVCWVPHPEANGEWRLELPDAPEAAIALKGSDIVQGPERVHVAEVRGLEPGRRYGYVLRRGARAVEGEFRTAIPRDTGDAFRFVIYGDNRSGPERHRRVLEAVGRELPFTFIVNTGDLTANATAWPQWKKEFFDPGREVWRRTTFWPVRGNHEVDGVLVRTLFDLPGERCYYSADTGGLHLVVLDSELLGHDGDRAAHAEMVRWLDGDLARCGADWIIAVFHEPIFNIGGAASRWGRGDVLEVLERHGADLVLASHSHIYERFRPIGPEGGKPVVHIVSGGGGGPEYELRPSPVLARNYVGLHYCAFEIDGNRLTMAVKTPDGDVIDELELVKDGGAYQESVMRDALTTEEGAQLAYVEAARVALDLRGVPEPGARVQAGVVLRDPLPDEAVVRLSSAEGSPWKVELTEFTVGDAVREVTIIAPDDLDVRPGFLRPTPRLHRSVSYDGVDYAGQDIDAGLTRASVRLLIPDPTPSPVPHAPNGMVVDGVLDDWEHVPYLQLPSTDAPSRYVRAAWSEKGIYLAVAVPDGGTAGAGIELYIEDDHARSFSAIGNPHAGKYSAGPAEDEGRARVRVSYGPCMHRPDMIDARWRAWRGGYAVEFLVPASAMPAAAMTPGAVLGFHYVLSGGGHVLEQFLDPEGKPGVWHIPLYWGAVRLA